MIGDRAKGLGVTAKTPRSRLQPRALFHLDAEPIDFETESPINNKDIIYACTEVILRYIPSSISTKQKEPFTIRFNAFKEDWLRVSSWEDFEEKAKQDKVIGFLFKYSGLTKEHFDLAYEHVGFQIYTGIDLLRYIKDVKDKIEARTGVRPTHTVLFNPILNECERERHQQFLRNNSVYTKV